MSKAGACQSKMLANEITHVYTGANYRSFDRGFCIYIRESVLSLTVAVLSKSSCVEENIRNLVMMIISEIRDFWFRNSKSYIEFRGIPALFQIKMPQGLHPP